MIENCSGSISIISSTSNNAGIPSSAAVWKAKVKFSALFSGLKFLKLIKSGLKRFYS